jgi:hypothetical protein
MGSAWTAGERSRAVRMARSGKLGAEIAAALGRTLAGVKHQLKRAGVKLLARVPVINPWTAAEDAEAIDLRRRGWSYSAIGARIRRCKESVHSRLRLLGSPAPVVLLVELRRSAAANYREPTMAELDTLIAERYASMPTEPSAEERIPSDNLPGIRVLRTTKRHNGLAMG